MEDIQQKINHFFQDLKFEEKQHRYTVGSDFLPSVSSLIKKFHKPFTGTPTAQAKRRGVSEEVILKEWDDKRIESCDRGHRVHLFGEHYVYNRNMKPSCPQEEAIVKFWNDVPDHIVPCKMELQMYHKYFMFAGTCDILLYDTKNKTFILGDYKTNEDLFKNFKQKRLLYPFNNLLDSPFNKYQLQLSFYQILFEQIGLRISSRKLIWLSKDGTYKMYDTEDYTLPLLSYLTNRN